ncbi:MULTISPECIES: thioesterase II family protein [Bacillus]|uniref:thioesterase II family protein n=1 Tax=Bacillus TaxID=1386 RepID=UPI000F798624|nr:MULTISPECIES: thioesterase domain-containing protein [Bacillus]MDJ0287732.1 thioesterase domain-containing protein [Bacillus altitudinis]
MINKFHKSQWFNFKENTGHEKKIRLFCFPYAGGGSSLYKKWESSEVEIVSVQLPGRENRFKECAFSDLETLLECLIEEISPFLDKSFAFFGHSMGALVSFELARKLRKNKMMLPSYLFLSAFSAPSIYKGKGIHNLDDEALINEIINLNGTPKEIAANTDLMRLFLPLLRSDFSIIDNYKYVSEPKLSVPMMIFGGLEDSIPRSDLIQWQVETNESFNLTFLPGDHFYIHDEKDNIIDIIDKELSMKNMLS